MVLPRPLMELLLPYIIHVHKVHLEKSEGYGCLLSSDIDIDFLWKFLGVGLFRSFNKL